MHTTTLFSDELQASAKAIWEKNHLHPFVQGISKGTLDEEIFAFYLKQDYLYLIEYSKVFALGALKSHNLQTMNKFSQLLHETLHIEMDLHRQYAAEFGITAKELEMTQPAPITLAYSGYMLNTGYKGTLVELIACVLPCAWDYREIGLLLKEQNGDKLGSNRYAKWIRSYSSNEFIATSNWLIELMNELTEGLPLNELEKIKQHFITSSRFEYLFWDMAYNQNEWPL